MDVVRSEWAGFFDRLSNDHLGDQVEIEVLDPELGDQMEVERMPFGTAAYDQREDTVVVSVGQPVTMRHMVTQPDGDRRGDARADGDRRAGGGAGRDDAGALLSDARAARRASSARRRGWWPPRCRRAAW